MLLHLFSEIKVIGEAQTGQEAIEQAVRLRPHIVILDITLPDRSGLEVCKEIHVCVTETHIVMLTMHENKSYFFQSLQAGVQGYLLKKAAPEDLYRAIRAMLQGHVFVSYELLHYLLPFSLEARKEATEPFCAKSPAQVNLLSQLTPRQRQMLQSILQGQISRQIASDLGISVKTVQAHRTNLMEKLGVNNVAQLVRLAIRSGACSPNSDDCPS